MLDLIGWSYYIWLFDQLDWTYAVYFEEKLGKFIKRFEHFGKNIEILQYLKIIGQQSQGIFSQQSACNGATHTIRLKRTAVKTQ